MLVQNFVETLEIWQVIMPNMCNSCQYARSADDQTNSIQVFPPLEYPANWKKSKRNIQWPQQQWSTPWSFLGSFGEVCSDEEGHISAHLAPQASIIFTAIAATLQALGPRDRFRYFRKHQRIWKFLVLDTTICRFTVTWEIFNIQVTIIYKTNWSI